MIMFWGTISVSHYREMEKYEPSLLCHKVPGRLTSLCSDASIIVLSDSLGFMAAVTCDPSALLAIMKKENDI